MTDRIHTMRSYFTAAGHGTIGPRIFAPSMLLVAQRDVARELAEVGFVQAQRTAVLEIKALGDPDKPVAAAVAAYVSGSAWVARCECGGVEFVDFLDPIFMCCRCWNLAFAYAWRPVTLPLADLRFAVEVVLLERPVEKTRSWAPGEKIAQLLRENLDHGVPALLSAIDLAKAGG